jgi:ammonia channel protein AmtB
MDVSLEYGLVTLGVVFALAGDALLAGAFMRRSKKFAIFAISFLAISAVLVGRLAYAEFWDIDTCLDAGGTYDYETSACRYD